MRAFSSFQKYLISKLSANIDLHVHKYKFSWLTPHAADPYISHCILSWSLGDFALGQQLVAVVDKCLDFNAVEIYDFTIHFIDFRRFALIFGRGYLATSVAILAQGLCSS